MSYVFTYTTKIKNKNYNQSLCKYISDWTIVFNKIQRKVWQQLKDNTILCYFLLTKCNDYNIIE